MNVERRQRDVKPRNLKRCNVTTLPYYLLIITVLPYYWLDFCADYKVILALAVHRPNLDAKMSGNRTWLTLTEADWP